jgi:hypothetical protein
MTEVQQTQPIPDIEQEFLAAQLREALELASESDLVDVLPLGPRTYAVRFQCKGLVQERDGTVHEADRFVVEIQLGKDHLRVKPGPMIMRMAHPANCFSANIVAPLMCGGDLGIGVSVVDLIYQAFEMITWQNVTIREEDALNRAACQWARSHPDDYPIDTRPLKWRRPEEVAP